MELSFKLTEESIGTYTGEILYRIEAIRDIPFQGVKKGDRGGFVSSERLTNGDARISEDAWVSGNAMVSGNAWVFGNAKVSGNAWVSENAQVYGNAWVSGDARVYGYARVFGDASVFENAWVTDNARAYGNAKVFGDAWVYGYAWVADSALVSGDAKVFGDAQVSGDAKIDSLDSIIVLTIPTSYHVTVTRDMIFAGCKSVKRSHVKNMTCQEFVEMGGKKEYFKAYKEMVLGAMKIVRKRK
jgi:carbonic anhydrase/acetyltransferase-like protein (isoleucine patch superfamily)